MLDKADLDTVLVLTPNHARPAIDAARRQACVGREAHV